MDKITQFRILFFYKQLWHHTTWAHIRKIYILF